MVISSICCMPENCQNARTWTRILGLPLQLWTREKMKEIRKRCRGCIEKEETKLKNHLQYAHMRIKGDTEQIPSHINIEWRFFSIPSRSGKKLWKESAVKNLQTVTRGSKAGIVNSLHLGLDDMTDPILGRVFLNFKPSAHASTNGKELMENLEDATLWSGLTKFYKSKST